MIRERRARLGVTDVHSSVLGQLPPLGTVAGYLAKAGEPSIDAWLASLQSTGATIYLPRVHGSDMTWVNTDSFEDLPIGAFGVREPHGDGNPTLPHVDAIVMPALAVDVRGYRLGQGGGYYDRALANTTKFRDGGPLRVAVINEDEFLDVIPHEAHDVCVDVVCTQAGVHWIDESVKP
jgi:5-formyltetrahydrofolate cyclo-ligase